MIFTSSPKPTPASIYSYMIFIVAIVLLGLFPDNSSAQTEIPVNIQVTNILKTHLSSRVELRDSDNTIIRSYLIPDGQLKSTIPSGKYTIYIFVYDNAVPYCVFIRDVTIGGQKLYSLDYELLEGSGPDQYLEQFDTDGDLFLGRVETEQGTDPTDSLSVPGLKLFKWPEQVISSEKGWYRGELHAQSKYGRGKETVDKIIKRAESLDLDFLAILDRNTLDSAFDKKYTSKSTVLIPGIEWGNDENGVALVYAPRFLPLAPKTNSDMRTYTQLLQSQGALVFAGHPCFPGGVWNWSNVPFDGVQAWCMGWGIIPPIGLGSVREENRVADTIKINRKDKKGNPVTEERIKYKRAIALAANTRGTSANGQATKFWDLEMSRGFKLDMIGGSQTGSPKVKMAEPVTYVYANEKSLDGILNAISLGRTYVSRGLDGPKIDWVADILDDGVVDTTMGGQIPLDEVTRFYGRIRDAKGKKLVMMHNGIQSMTMPIPNDNWVFTFDQKPEMYSVYRLKVIEPGIPKKHYSFTNVLAMTSPIYADGIIPDDLGTGTREWLQIDTDEYVDPEDLDNYIENLKKAHEKVNSTSKNSSR